jgi:hypothetical protein
MDCRHDNCRAYGGCGGTPKPTSAELGEQAQNAGAPVISRSGLRGTAHKRPRRQAPGSGAFVLSSAGLHIAGEAVAALSHFGGAA